MRYAASKRMRYREQLAETPAGRRMECSWSLETVAPVHAYRVPPDGCVDIVYARETGAHVVGAMTVERRFDLAAGARTIGVRFRPGMAGAFLGAAPVEFTDRTVALEDVWGGRARQLQSLLADAAHGDLDLEWAARHACLSARQFRRRCLEESGLTPKHLCRVLRFRRAYALAAQGANWASIASDVGYFDQAHLIRDFREFTGRAPMSVFSKTRTVPAG